MIRINFDYFECSTYTGVYGNSVPLPLKKLDNSDKVLVAKQM